MAKNWRLTADGKIYRFGRKRSPNGDTYEGEFVDGIREGKGTLQYANGNNYSGAFKDNKFHGFGVYAWADFAEGSKVVRNRRYEGHWELGQQSGKGLYFLGNGDVYEGDFERGMYHGAGKMKTRTRDVMEGEWQRGHLSGKASITYSNGDKYEGQFFAGRFQGKGSYVFAHGRGWYEGAYYQGKQHGKGTRVFANNNRYEGNFSHGEPDGEGIMEYSNGNQYIGSWKRGKMHGRGLLQLANGEKYEGEFHEGYFFGRGRYTYTDGGYFDGEYVTMKGAKGHDVKFPDANGKRNGFGVRVWVNGDKYEGEWRDDVPYGRAVVRKASGGRFTGEYYRGNKSGEGKETFGNTLGVHYTCPMGFRHEGRGWCVYQGTFQDGHFHGHGTFQCCDGRRYEGQWRRGRRHGWGEQVLLTGVERGDAKRQFIGGFDAMYRPVLYRGAWEEGYWTGKGTVHYANGIEVVGTLDHGRFNGVVEWRYPKTERTRHAWYDNGERCEWLDENDPRITAQGAIDANPATKGAQSPGEFEKNGRRSGHGKDKVVKTKRKKQKDKKALAREQKRGGGTVEPPAETHGTPEETDR
uniref:Uncharacterized protein n=1 Tax=Rhizochromulina marina TaxID=1034831 RepID=A0A7S2S1K0_9STRA|mmetsp:Transcript_23844/g.69843  ORF Transcript_23844/g.69843 Transcript_23844/m.69843 type:complete len:578 (+) Transcript_23844:64-1797(+)